MAELTDHAAAPPRAESRQGLLGSQAGLLYGLSAYTIWGFIPVYFRAVAHLPPLIVLCHRIIWSAIFIGLVVTVRGEWQAIFETFRSRRQVLLLSLGAVLIAANWLIFIHAVATKQVLQASLGYFINPLLSITLGVVFLQERLRAWQWAAVLIVILAVANLALRGPGLPWIAVSLAATFAFYGLVRKKVDINSVHGLLIEAAILLPLAVIALAILPAAEGAMDSLGLLSLSGVITAVPLLFFGAALRRLKLSTLGFLQYVGPTLQLLVAVWLFQEPLDPVKLGSFALCWLAIAVYIADSIIRRYPPATEEPD